MDDKPQNLPFPIRGVNVATSFGQQPKESTPVGENCRAFESIANRGRGGSRPGLSKFLADTVPAGAFVIQHLNIIVDPQSPALLGDVDPQFPDPSTNNLRTRVPSGSMVRVGGSGVNPRANTGSVSTDAISLVQSAFDEVSAGGGVPATGTITFATTPKINNRIIVVTRMFSLETISNDTEVTNGDGEAFEQIGSDVSIETTVVIGSIEPVETPLFLTLALWQRKSSGGLKDKTVLVTTQPGAGSGNYGRLQAFDYKGVNTADPFSDDASGSGENGTYSSASAGTPTTVSNGGAVFVAFSVIGDAQEYTAPTGFDALGGGINSGYTVDRCYHRLGLTLSPGEVTADITPTAEAYAGICVALND